MNKQNKLILRVFKAALKAAEAAEKARARQDIEYGTSSTLRPGGTYRPNTDNSPEPPMGKNNFCLEDVAHVKQDASSSTVQVLLKTGEFKLLSTEEWYCVSSKYGEKPYTSNKKPKEGQVTWRGRLIVTKEEYEQENLPAGKAVEDFAGDDRSHVYSLIEKHLGINRTDCVFGNGRAFVHLKSPELGTETLVVLSPEGETLLKIVKDNSRKFEVR